MKSYLNYIIAIIFFLQTSLGSMAFADTQAMNKPTTSTPTAAPATTPAVQSEEAAEQPSSLSAEEKAVQARIMEMAKTRPYSALLEKDSICEGKEQLLESFINEVGMTDGNGNQMFDENQKPKTYKGKLKEKELEFGDRNFDFDRLSAERFNSKHDEATQFCLHNYSRMALGEWGNYFLSRSNEFECGLKFGGAEDGSLKVENETGKKTEACDVPYGDSTLHDFLSKQMTRFTEVFNDFKKKELEAMAKAQGEATDKARTEAGTGCTGPDCDPSSKLAKDSQYIKGTEERLCCDRINNRWEELGFTTVKDAKPSDRICKDMIEKDSDTGYCEGNFCLKDMGNCLKNLASTFMRDFFSSIVDGFNVFGWGSQLMALWNEVTSNPMQAAQNIVKSLFGFNGDYMQCLNRKSQTQYVCQMIGKFAGSSAGFSAGMGALLGLVRGASLGIVAKATKGKGIAGYMAGQPKGGIVMGALKDAGKTGARAAAVGAVWPIYAGRGLYNGVKKTVSGTWAYVPYSLDKMKNGVTSAAAKASERFQTATGRVVEKPGAAAATGLETTAAATPAKAAGGNLGKQIAEAEKVLAQRNADLNNLVQFRNSLTKGKKLDADGKPVFKNGTEAQTNYQKAVEGIKAIEDDIAKVSARANELKAKVQRNSANNKAGVLLGTGVTSYGAEKSQAKSQSNKAKPPAVKDDGTPVATPVKGVGTGQGIPGAGAQKAAPEAQKPAGASPAAGETPPAATPANKPAAASEGGDSSAPPDE
jgi:hypothetical protein